ncbi:pirin family protein [Paenibacillus sp. HN-1]|uniref:pirin family protein n=1 Tax=Paenibacillus TaxID=44249 RepID=UPI001CA98A03|nr:MULTISPECIES: pirin family protein [Paenibacillus]MBY9077059.1 pirin family protein [Paenibacillus sp. CGMCC 1.18879]MBY9086568.1 pirin family protein [Paenibacillus sinensis]
MIKVVTSAERHTSNKEWIHSEFSFSFADYDDPGNSHFGSLLAHNDNELKPLQGMHRHPHHDLEIVTYVISGTLRHEDDLGNKVDLQAGSVQIMSAGRGIRHSEQNPSETENVRFLQIWLLPNAAGLPPKWDAKYFPPEHRKNTWLKAVSGEGEEVEGALNVRENVSIYLASVDTGQDLVFPQREDRRTHVFVITGNADIICADGSFSLSAGDAARIRECCEMSVLGTGSGGPAELILIDLP